jgi:hypothetical protein
LIIAGAFGCGSRQSASTPDALEDGMSNPDASSSDAGRLCDDDGCTSAGCPPLLVYRFDPYSERGLAVGAHELCVAFNQLGSANTEYHIFNRCGGPSTSTVSNGYAVGMLLDGDELTTGVGVALPNAWAKLWRRDLSAASPGQATLLWSTEAYPFGFDNLLRSGDTLYFSYNNPIDSLHQGIYKVPYAGGSPQQISNWVLQDVRQAMVRVASTLYFSYIPSGGQYGLYAMPTSGGTPTLLSVPRDATILNSVATDGQRLYWGALGSATNPRGLVGSIALDGSSPETLADVGAQVLELAVDADTVYFTTTGSGGMGLYAVPVTGGSVTTVLAGSPRIDLLRQDVDYLFFVGRDGAYRLRKRGR